jgi:hypothetical protein
MRALVTGTMLGYYSGILEPYQHTRCGVVEIPELPGVMIDCIVAGYYHGDMVLAVPAVLRDQLIARAISAPAETNLPGSVAVVYLSVPAVDAALVTTFEESGGDQAVRITWETTPPPFEAVQETLVNSLAIVTRGRLTQIGAPTYGSEGDGFVSAYEAGPRPSAPFIPSPAPVPSAFPPLQVPGVSIDQLRRELADERENMAG